MRSELDNLSLGFMKVLDYSINQTSKCFAETANSRPEQL
jgi:hypothetical protein